MSEVIHAHSGRDRWTPIWNDAIRDKRLSFRATGLLCYLLSLPPNWKPHQAHIIEQKTEGRDAVFTAWKELQELGYIVKELRRGSQGVIEETIWHVYENPSESTALLENRKAVLPEDGKTVTKKDLSDKKDLGKKDSLSLFPDSEIQKTNPDVGKSMYDSISESQIETIRLAYPKMVDSGPARKAIRKALERRSYEFLLSKTKSFAICKMTTDPKYIKSPQNWYNDENYEDDEAQWTETPHANYQRSQQAAQGIPKEQPKMMMSAEQRREIRRQQEDQQ